MAKNQLARMLSSPDKEETNTSGANGVLSRLWRRILKNLNITGNRWGSLMQDFVMDTRNGVPDNKKDQTSMRGNLNKDLIRPQMTWKVFCKGLRFLQIVKIEIHIKAYHEDGSTSLHSTEAYFGSRKDCLNDFQDWIDKEDDDDEAEENDE